MFCFYIIFLLLTGLFTPKEEVRKEFNYEYVSLKSECGIGTPGNRYLDIDGGCLFHYNKDNPPILLKCKVYMSFFIVETVSKDFEKSIIKCTYSDRSKTDPLCSMCVDPVYDFESLLDIIIARLTWIRWLTGLID